jgi:hypothetical protein
MTKTTHLVHQPILQHNQSAHNKAGLWVNRLSLISGCPHLVKLDSQLRTIIKAHDDNEHSPCPSANPSTHSFIGGDAGIKLGFCYVVVSLTKVTCQFPYPPGQLLWCLREELARLNAQQKHSGQRWSQEKDRNALWDWNWCHEQW